MRLIYLCYAGSEKKSSWSDGSQLKPVEARFPEPFGHGRANETSRVDTIAL